MSVALVRTNTAATYLRFHRSIGYLSDNSVVVAIYDSGNDNLYIYRSTDRTTWTLVITVTNLAVVGSILAGSMVVDAADNIHLIWTATDVASPRKDNLYYKKYTYSAGPTWSAGATEAAFRGASGQNPWDGLELGICDLDVTDAGWPVVTVKVKDTTWNPDAMSINCLSKKSGGWSHNFYLTWGQADGHSALRCMTSIMRDPRGATGGKHRLYQIGQMYSGVVVHGAFLAITESTGACAFETYHLGVYDAGNTDFGVLVPGANASGGTSPWHQIQSVKNATEVKSHLIKCDHAATLTNPTFLSLPTFSGWSLSYNYNSSPGGIMKGLAGVFGVDSYTYVTRPGVAEAGRTKVWTWGGPWTWGIEIDWPKKGGAIWYYLANGANRHIPTDRADMLGCSTTTGVYFASNDAPAAPTAVEPVSGATVTTDLPTLKAVLGVGETASWAVLGEWQVADDAGFTTNVKTIIEPWSDQRIRSTAPVSEVVPGASELNQGTKYIRARTISVLNRSSAWSASHSFTVSHPPTTTGHMPTGNPVTLYTTGDITFSWVFSDTSSTDVQTAYQIQIERNADASLVSDTGKVVSGATSTVINIASGEKNQTLRWRIRVYDSDDVAGPWSDYHLFEVSDPPGVSVTAPAEAAVVDNPQPTVTWTYTPINGRIQSSYRVTFRRVSDSVIVHQSAWIGGTATSYTPPTAVLENTTNYTVQVEVKDTANLTGTDSNNFSTSWTAPTQVGDYYVDAELFDTEGYVGIFWSNASQDLDFLYYRVYRTEVATGERVLIAQVESQPFMSWHDWFAKSNVAYRYEVSQVADRFGSWVESSTDGGITVMPTSTHYWLIHPDSPAQEDDNLQLRQVTNESFTEEYETDIVHILGRGRKADIGDRIGFSGELTCQVWDGPEKTAREFRLALEDLKATKRELFLRNPFGDLWQVNAGDIQITRDGGLGHREHHEAVIPYVELS